ncbi:MAG: M56 family metallopeptidase [Cyanobacteria bacterium J06600_6]
MHLLTILIVVSIAILLRSRTVSATKEWSSRWYQTLFLFCFPGLLMLTTAVAVLYMGCHGHMLGMRAGSVGCLIAIGLILFASASWFKLAYQSYCSLHQLRCYPQETIANTTARVLDLELPYSAQAGFWQSELIVSRGLLTVLDAEHLTAVVAHEQAHAKYRDPFWFFWLGWIRSFSFWLPNTEALWQELLLLRELRADRQATESVDFLLLAESLLAVAKAPLEPAVGYIGFNDAQTGDRLQVRIDSLLNQTESIEEHCWQRCTWLGWLFLPWLTIPLHY